MYARLCSEDRASLQMLVSGVRSFLRAASDEDVHKAVLVLEAIGQIDSTLISMELIEELADADDTTKRMTAALLLWDRAEVAPADVPLGLLGRLARPAVEDWYVQAPAMAATKQLLLRRRRARVIFDVLAVSVDVDDRFAVASALLDIAMTDPIAAPVDLAERLSRDPDELVTAKAQEAVAAIGKRPDDFRDPRAPFGL